MVQAFEELEIRFAESLLLDPAHMVACASGTAALQLAFTALKCRKVWMSDFNMIAAPRALKMAGGSPRFVDCTDDGNIDFREVLDGFPILATHIYGRTPVLTEFFQKNGSNSQTVIEDMAETAAVRPHCDSTAACWSFYQNKIIAGEEGGAVWFKYKRHADVARMLRCQGFTPDHDFNHVPGGFNGRLSNANACLILQSLSRLAENLQLRRDVEAAYNEDLPSQWHRPARQSPWVYDLRIAGMTRAVQKTVVRSLNNTGIEARMSFLLMTATTEFREPEYYLPVHPVDSLRRDTAYRLSNETFYLPLNVRPEQVPRIAEIVCLKIEQAFGTQFNPLIHEQTK